ncbi:copper chaperone PCu(A)C [Halomonas sp. E14]|uniref:copper chaperone PCu(A)C n=1 Tax=Halomonas sp. E14 TaxID=3397245 RepID=UPI00403E714C
MMKPRSLLAALGLSLLSLPVLAEPLAIEQAQVRAVPPGAEASAAFMVLHNPGDAEVRLVEAASPAAAALELHHHVDVDGVMQMRRIADITIPPGGSATLAPGGLHLMLIGLTQPLVEGEPVAIELVFEDGRRQALDAPVARVSVQAVDDAAHAHHGHAH